jgi:hypothetical protein
LQRDFSHRLRQLKVAQCASFEMTRKGRKASEFSRIINQGEIYVLSNWLLDKPMGLEFVSLSRYPFTILFALGA